MSTIFTCPKCNDKVVESTEKMYCNCIDGKSVEMRSESLRVRASSIVLHKIRDEMRKEGLITDDAFSFGNRLGMPLEIPFETRRKSFLPSERWKINKEDVKKAITKAVGKQATVQFTSSNLVDNRELRKVKVDAHQQLFKEMDKIREEIANDK